ncbi:HlyD family type I secretion periplasmic adaptor subunit [Telmatospirillum sp.]|uniref:HlyD family type I secretion periplasmic adaptor subunit n=1 Tax=Telmatospirillum sp. TaxID=2079197 RepID=UPI00283E2C96|nr:HlyD family type I secretion periplasmic adaptor subunit [Telmatospirillum sp.]MDR3436486.1 HlyD family type I secretion periplasmic adaptor subunit [Telmatospirillum sp.]
MWRLKISIERGPQGKGGSLLPGWVRSLPDTILMRLEPLRRHIAVWKAAWATEKMRPKESPRTAEELAFLPAVIEIVETPASPLGRATAAVIIALFTIALAWSSIGQLDIHATASGRIIPGGKTKPVASSESATVLAIHVADGDHVRQGQVLVELDPTQSFADATRLKRERLELLLTAARLHSLLDGRSDIESPAGEVVPPNLLALHREELRHKAADHKAAVINLEQERLQKQAELRSAQADVERLQQTVPLLAEQARVKEEMSSKGWQSRTEYLRVQQDYIDRRQGLGSALEKRTEAEAAIAGANERLRQIESQFRAETLGQLTDAEQKAASLSQELAKAEQRDRLMTLTAPVDGVVQQLAVHAPGAVVSQGSPVLMVVPENEGIAVEVSLPNKDAGFVLPGQAVEIKVESFPFTRYGTVPGTVQHVSGDAVQNDGDSGQRRGGGANGDDQAPVYSVRIKPSTDHITADGRLVALTPGMAVTAEIKIGKRRVIEYLLDPVLRYRDESFRER